MRHLRCFSFDYYPDRRPQRRSMADAATGRRDKSATTRATLLATCCQLGLLLWPHPPFLPPTARLPHRHVSVLAREPLHFCFFSFHFLLSAGRLSVFFRLRDTVWHITSAFYVDAVAVFLGRGSAGLNRRSRPMPFVLRGAAPRWRFREKRHRPPDRN